MTRQVNYFLHSKGYDSIIKGELIGEDESSYSSNRKIKDSVFRLLMDDEENLLALFNALEGAEYEDKRMISINTMKGALFKEMQNDLSFSVGDWYLSLIEHQSTITENAPTRQFIYLGRVWEQILDTDKLYRRKTVLIPTTKAYVLYNGREDFPMEKEYRLSKAFRQAADKLTEDEPTVEMIVKAININLHKGHPILEKCPILKEYSTFISRIRGKVDKRANRDIAVKESIRECIEEKVLERFLNRYGKEVYGMMLSEVTYEDVIRIRAEEAAEEAAEKAAAEATKQGMQQGKLEVARNLLELGIPVDQISKATGLPPEKIKGLQ